MLQFNVFVNCLYLCWLTENVNFSMHLRLFERGTFYFLSKGWLVQSNINITYYGKSYDLYECVYYMYNIVYIPQMVHCTKIRFDVSYESRNGPITS